MPIKLLLTILRDCNLQLGRIDLPCFLLLLPYLNRRLLPCPLSIPSVNFHRMRTRRKERGETLRRERSIHTLI